ncbi:MAG: LPS export ABC transporter periplasmic protein LptC [Pyrinomonadaceae bacterium]|nr:LPS export ABC transporter periplasmic protein LptC [Pyrinomonadaceae bacterium]
MAEEKVHNLKQYQLRAKLPQIFRYAAVVILGVTLLAVIAGFYRERDRAGFKLKNEHTRLSTDVVAEVSGYERLETDGELAKYYIKADHAKTFSDNHQELENVFIRIYDKDGNEADTMTALNVLHVPEADKNFTAYMKGNVDINARGGLNVKTNNIVYTKATETAEIDEAVTFERGGIRGKAFGASVRMAEKRLELLKDVEIEAFESPELAKSGVRYAKINSSSASYDQLENKIELKNEVVIALQSKSKSSGLDQKTDVNTDHAVVFLDGDVSEISGSTDPSEFNAQFKRLEMNGNVHIVTSESGMPPTTIDSGNAAYEKQSGRFELKNGAHIVTTSGGQSTDVRSSNAIYDQNALKFALNGNAEITQGSNYIKGDSINADLYSAQKVKYAVVSGNGFVRQISAERTTSISSPELNVSLNEAGDMRTANSLGQSQVTLDPARPANYSLVTMSTPRAIHVVFKGEGLIDSMQTDGRTTIQLNAVNNDSDAANKRVTADSVKTVFNANGQDIRRAEAVGNAELYIEPLLASAENYRTTINAPRFDCEFFPTGNNAKTCVGGKKTKTVRTPTVAAEGRGTQTLTADQISAAFSETTKAVERLDANGSAKFVELDRSAISSQMSFTQADGVVKLRGATPTIWDAASRAKATEIDWDSRVQRSQLRGGVSTTYYNRKSGGDATPFASGDKPVFVTSDTADFDHKAETAIFSGNARGWQDNNYVRGDRLTIVQREGKFNASGNVQSVLYDAKQKIGGKDASVPVFVSAKTLNYDSKTRLLQYRTDVDVRQGADRITSASTDVFMSEKNEVIRTVAEQNVVITQPGRRATGDRVEYTAENEVAVIRGNPASVSDSENGGSQSSEITVYMRENRFVGNGKTNKNTTGRTKTIYKVKPSQ